MLKEHVAMWNKTLSPFWAVFLMVAVSALVFVLQCITSVHVRFSRIDPTNKRVLRARARPQHSHSSNWTASIVTGTIFRPDWPVALCVRAHVLPAGCKRKGENTHTHGGEITVLGEFGKSEYTDIMLHRGAAGTLAVTWSCSLCQVSEHC